MILKPMLIRIFGNVLKNIVLPILFSFVVAYLSCTEKFTSVVLLNKIYIRTDLAHLGPAKQRVLHSSLKMLRARIFTVK